MMHFSNLALSLHFLIISVTVSEYCEKNGIDCNSKEQQRAQTFSLQNSVVTVARGHWPHVFVNCTDVCFSASAASFYIGQPEDASLFTKLQNFETWPLKQTSLLNIECNAIYDKAFVFTVYYWAKGSNYFHVLYDMALPLFSLTRNLSRSESVAVMPAVESKRMKPITFDIDAFTDDGKFWMEIMKLLFGSADLLPLDRKTLERNKTVCFRQAYFGTPRVDYTVAVEDFVQFVKKELGIPEESIFHYSRKHKVGLIKRSNRRLILNEPELVKAVGHLAETDMLKFEGKSFHEQVALVQNYAVIVGVNGAGLMNALFRCRGCVAIQLVPYNATQLNFKEFGKLLRVEGPYLEWHNKHEHLSKSRPGDQYNSSSDTIVHIEEYVQLINEALLLYDKWTSEQQS